MPRILHQLVTVVCESYFAVFCLSIGNKRSLLYPFYFSLLSPPPYETFKRSPSVKMQIKMSTKWLKLSIKENLKRRGCVQSPSGGHLFEQKLCLMCFSLHILLKKVVIAKSCHSPGDQLRNRSNIDKCT